MTKNSGKGGKKHKKLKNSETIDKELIFCDDGQSYAIITEMLGCGRCRAMSYYDKKQRLCIIRGNMRKKSSFFMRKGDTVLISFREYQDDKADIIHLYTEHDVKSLIEYKEIVMDDEEFQVEFKNTFDM